MARLTVKRGRGLIGHAVEVAEITYEPARQFTPNWLRRLILPKFLQALDAIQQAAGAPGFAPGTWFFEDAVTAPDHAFALLNFRVVQKLPRSCQSSCQQPR